MTEPKELVVCWDGARGWVEHDYGRGMLQPPHESSPRATEMTSRPQSAYERQYWQHHRERNKAALQRVQR